MIFLASLAEETQDKINGYKFIHTKEELDKIVADNISFNRVLIRSDFAQTFFTPSGLINYIENVKKFNHVIKIETDFNVVNNASFDSIVHSLNHTKDSIELVNLVMSHENEVMDVVHSLSKKQDDNYTQMLAYSNQIARLQAIIENQKEEIKQKDEQLEIASANALNYQSRFHTLISRINYQYGKNIDENKMFRVDQNYYDKILYIKELTRVQFTDSLVYYLKEILKMLFNMPTRLLVIEGYYANGKIDQYPNLKPHHELIERDVISGDILMLGMQPNIMQDILKNSAKVSILIILDRGGYAAPHVFGSNIEYLYTASDLKDVPEDIPYGRVISYSKESLYINYIKDFDKIDDSAKISKYSSMPIVKSIIALLTNKEVSKNDTEKEQSTAE